MSNITAGVIKKNILISLITAERSPAAHFVVYLQLRWISFHGFTQFRKIPCPDGKVPVGAANISVAHLQTSPTVCSFTGTLVAGEHCFPFQFVIPGELN